MPISHAVQPYTGPWSKIRDKNLRMRKIFNSKSPPKVHACADSCRDFLTTDLKFPVHDVVQEQCNSYGCQQSLDWTTGLDYWTGLLD